MTSLTARERVHIKVCRDDQCFIDYADPGDRCRNLDFLLDKVESQAGDREGLTGEARRERFIVYGETSLVCQECDSSLTMRVEGAFLPDLTEKARDHKCDPERRDAVTAFLAEREGMIRQK